jgi:hypothetical protein
MNKIHELTNKLLAFNNTIDFYRNESDRGAVILASSHLDYFLGECIKWFLIDEPSIEKELFQTYKPLSSFSGKISMAFALGLITKEMRENLNHIRKIRNYFAHHPFETSFNISPVRDWCSNFSILETVENQTYNHAQDQSDLRERFLFVVGLVALGIHSITISQQRRTMPGTSVP